SRGAQTVDSISIDIAFPGEKLIDRNAVKFTGLFDRNPAAAHGFNNGSLAPNRPSLGRLRQFRQRAKPVWPVRFLNFVLDGKLKHNQGWHIFGDLSPVVNFAKRTAA